MKRYLSALAILFLHSSCIYAEPTDQEPKNLQITDQRNAAAGFVFTYVATIVTVANTCKLESSLSQSTFDAFAKWHQRNGQYVEAAKGWLHYVGTQTMANQGPSAVSQFEDKVVRGSGLPGVETAKGFFANATRSTVCEKWIALLNSSQSDLNNSKNVYNKELEEIFGLYQSALARRSAR